MRRLTRPTEVGRVLASRRAARMATAACAAMVAWSSPWKARRRASPPNLRSAPPLPYGDLEHAGEHVVEDLGQLLGADAAPPGQPLRERGEARDVDETAGCVELGASRAPGASRSHSAARRGTYGSSPSSTAAFPIETSLAYGSRDRPGRRARRVGGTASGPARPARVRGAPGASPSARPPRRPRSGSRRARPAGSAGTTARSGR